MDKNYATGWNELKTKNSWMLFKIMGEFVEGFEKMGLHNPCISIFGSARTSSNHADYQLASEIAQRIVKLGFGVITGGGTRDYGSCKQRRARSRRCLCRANN